MKKIINKIKNIWNKFYVRLYSTYYYFIIKYKFNGIEKTTHNFHEQVKCEMKNTIWTIINVIWSIICTIITLIDWFK